MTVDVSLSSVSIPVSECWLLGSSPSVISGVVVLVVVVLFLEMEWGEVVGVVSSRDSFSVVIPLSGLVSAE